MNAVELTELAESAISLSVVRATVEPTLEIDGVTPSARIVIDGPRVITIDLSIDDDDQVRAALTIVSDGAASTTPRLIVETAWRLSRIIRTYVTED